jgi:four helix bundle protein
LDKLRFFNIAHGSLEDCQYYLILTRDLQYGDPAPLQPLLEETSKLLYAYAAAIRRRVAIQFCTLLVALIGIAASALQLL